MTDVYSELLGLSDADVKAFNERLLPTLDGSCILGVRTPDLKKIAIRMWKNGDYEEFLASPHRYFEEYNLHAFIISLIRDYGDCLKRVDAFLPSVNNWATCDQLRPKAFLHRPELEGEIVRWLGSPHTFTVRFGLEQLMLRLRSDFDPRHLELAAGVKSSEYYVTMMVAWYFAEALALRYDSALPYIGERRLEPKTLNKAIQKAIESHKISDEHKAELRALKVRR